MADIFRLKYGNILGDTIAFDRTKTSSQRKQKTIEVFLLPEIKSIITNWGNKPKKPTTYIFELISDEMSEPQKIAKIKQKTKQINKYVSRIGKELGIGTKVTTIVARHSFASRLKNLGEPVAFIQEAMGHQNISTTQNYLANFEVEHRKQAAEKLIDL